MSTVTIVDAKYGDILAKRVANCLSDLKACASMAKKPELYGLEATILELQIYHDMFEVRKYIQVTFSLNRFSTLLRDLKGCEAIYGGTSDRPNTLIRQ